MRILYVCTYTDENRVMLKQLSVTIDYNISSQLYLLHLYIGQIHIFNILLEFDRK